MRYINEIEKYTTDVSEISKVGSLKMLIKLTNS